MVPSFQQVDPGSWTQIVRLGGKSLHPLSHLTGPGIVYFFNEDLRFSRENTRPLWRGEALKVQDRQREALGRNTKEAWSTVSEALTAARLWARLGYGLPLALP